MPRVAAMALFVVLIAGARTGTSLLGQTPPPPPPPPPQPAPVVRDPGSAGGPAVRRIPVGTAQISGTVTDASTGSPLRGVRVNLNGTPVMPTAVGPVAQEGIRGGVPGLVPVARGQAVSRATVTDDQGRFVFDRLPAGRFDLSANRTQYLSAVYGQRRPGGAGTAIAIDEHQRLDILLPLVRGGVITGMVLDERGEPQPSAQVRAFRYSFVNGVRRLQGAGAGMTDDRGQYRLHGLQVGEYVVSATPSPAALGADRGLMEALAIEEAIRSATPQPPAAAGAPSTVLVPVLRQPGSTPVPSGPVGYLPTYYPGTMRPGEAASIRIAGGDEHPGTDIVVRAVLGTNVSGTFGPPLDEGVGLRVSVAEVDGSLLDGSLPTSVAMIGQDGRFALRNLPTGRYQILAQTMPRRTTTIIDGARASPSPLPPQPLRLDDGQRLWGMATIAVAGEPEIQTHIVLQPGRSVSGVVRFDLSPAGPVRPGGTVTLANAPGAQANAVSSPPQAQVGPDGRFTLRGVIPGRYVFRTNLGSLKEATVDGRDALDFPLEFTGERDIADVVLTVTDQTTVLSGVLTDSREQPAVDYSVVVATADPRYWTPGSRRVMLTRPDTSGRYSFRNLPPGDYLLAVVDDIEAGAHFDPEFLRGLTGSAVRITLTEGATVTSNLRVGR